ncbi:hypothetical protein QE177_03465 [Arsenophonus sp. aPb]|uniref:hypothetical protein n=1 Tax=Arsenophonus sp. aPb TaxID=3041619 RepID=UPI0024693A30|nr:hypothetical protein [Arsenophonus sp. aPb]WGL98968.1 hypothetical protein QE177_03465 [Arsenophonus sp. aPb]
MTAISNSDNKAISYPTHPNIDDPETISSKEKPSIAGSVPTAANIKNIINNINTTSDELEKPLLRKSVKPDGKDSASDVKEAVESLLANVENRAELFNFLLTVKGKEGSIEIDENLNVSNRFEITQLANGYTGNQDKLIQAMLMAALSQLETRRQLANMEVKIAYDSIKSSANNMVEAAQEGKKQAITTAMVSITMAGAGTFGSIKSLTKQNSSLKLHDSQAVKLNADAIEQRNAAYNASRAGTDNEAAAAFMSNSQEYQTKAQLLQLTGRETQNQAQKGLVAANALNQNSAVVGQMAGQQNATAQAEKSAQSQVDSAVERAYNEIAQISKKAQDEFITLLKQILDMFMEEYRRRAQTSRAIIG